MTRATMTCDAVMAELERLGTEQTRKTWLRHGAPEPLFGVRIGDMQPLRKILGKNRGLALELFATGNVDAQYLAGLIADETAMTKADLQAWVEESRWHMIGESIVPQLTAETPHARALALKWIKSKQESLAAAGWATLACHVSLTNDDALDLDELIELVEHVEQTIHAQPNRVRYAMNGFVASVGCYVPKLTARALAAAKTIGPVHVDMGDTACQVTDIAAVIKKVQARGTIGKKRKHARC